MFKVNKTGKLTANVKNMRLFRCEFWYLKRRTLNIEHRTDLFAVC